MGIFSFGRKDTNNQKDLFSTAIFASRPAALVTEEQALSIPSVKASVELISNSIATLPVYLYEQHDESDIRKVPNDERVDVLNSSSNEIDAAQTLKKKLVQDVLLHGRSFLYKEDGKLYHLEAKNVEITYYTDNGFTPNKRSFEYRGPQTITLDESQIVVIDSGQNGVLIDGGKILSQALNQIDYSSSLLENSAVPTSVLKASSRLTEPAINRLRETFTSLYGGPRRSGKTLILEEGLDFQPISMKPNELGLHEANKQIVSEIAKLFNIPESMINSAANKYNSLEQNNVTFLQSTLAPIITSIESAFDKHLLEKIEKYAGFYFRFDTSEILRTTEEQKIKTTAEAFNKGLMSYNEMRTKLDLPKESEDFSLLSIGNVMRYKSDGRIEYLNLGPQTNQPEVDDQNESKGTTN